MNLLAPKLELHGIKAICVDDLIAPKKTARTSFLSKSRLYHQDVFFADAYEPALEILDTHPEISLAFVDMRIPRRSQDRHDFNPENPNQEWGKKLVEELLEKYPKQYPEREIDIIVITAYTIYNFSSRKKKSSSVRIRARYKKPVNYDSLIEDIAFVVKNRRERTFDYTLLDEQLSSFVQEKTQEINRLSKRLAEDIYNIGRYLIEVKAKLKYGQFYAWIDKELELSSASVTRFMQVASSFSLEEVKELDLLPTALYELATTNAPKEAVKEAIERAKQGEKITQKTAKAIKEKYRSVKKVEQPVALSNQTKEKEARHSILPASLQDSSQTLPSLLGKGNLDKPKQEILGVVPSQNAVKNSWWQLGEHHRLFCGESKNKEFLKRIPKEVALKINFLPQEDYSLIPAIESIFTFTVSSKYNDLEIEALVEECIRTGTKPKETIVFNYVYYADLLKLAEKFDCYFWAAEPDLNKCQQILTIWREKGAVRRSE